MRHWIDQPPGWLLVRSPARIEPNLKLDAGEVHAISLAEELHADHILIDEWAARAVASTRGLHVVGTLGVLDQAAARGLIDLKQVFERLRLTTFRVDAKLLDQLLEQEDLRRRPPHNE